MCLIVHHNYAGPRSGTFFKVLLQDNGRLLSPMMKTAYPPSGTLPVVTATPYQNIDTHGYHVFARARDAMSTTLFMPDRRLYAVTARAENFVAGGLWTFNGSTNAIFRTLNVLGPFTGNA